MIDRPGLLGILRRALRTHPVAALLGPRQCGKTALAAVLAADGRSTRFDLENPTDLAGLAGSIR